MNLKDLQSIVTLHGGSDIYVKSLAPNDNSKNQVYLGGSFDVISIFPMGELQSESSGNWKKERIKAKVDFAWIDDDGSLSDAPNTQIIMYPKYPEIRLSGFLNGCKNSPSALMHSRDPDRILFLSILNSGKIIGYVTPPFSKLAQEFYDCTTFDTYGIFKVIPLAGRENSRDRLIEQLTRIHNQGWINSKKLTSIGDLEPCNAPNCGGFTLEAELGIPPNSRAEPDYLGWEIKQFNVKSFDHYKNSVITLWTPEPTGGFYKEKGVEQFLRTYGYPDRRGRSDRINFGGIHRVGEITSLTSLKMDIVGYDSAQNKIRKSDGYICLLDNKESEVASWSFLSLIKHWNCKHNKACYVPSIKQESPDLQYMYSDKLILGIGTEFTYFLKELSKGIIYYDPGIKMENVSTKPKIKRRSQFRIKSGNLVKLYKNNEIVNLK